MKKTDNLKEPMNLGYIDDMIQHLDPTSVQYSKEVINIVEEYENKIQQTYEEACKHIDCIDYLIYELKEKKQPQSVCTIACLRSLGMDAVSVQAYIQAGKYSKKSIPTRITILRKTRKKILNTMHDAKNAIDSIAYIRKEMK